MLKASNMIKMCKTVNGQNVSSRMDKNLCPLIHFLCVFFHSPDVVIRMKEKPLTLCCWQDLWRATAPFTSSWSFARDEVLEFWKGNNLGHTQWAKHHAQVSVTHPAVVSFAAKLTLMKHFHKSQFWNKTAKKYKNELDYTTRLTSTWFLRGLLAHMQYSNSF